MTKECFLKQFADAKKRMELNEAANMIHRLRMVEFEERQRKWHVSPREDREYLARQTACMELEEAMRSVSPWEDWREIIAEYEWPYMRRVVNHMAEDKWDEPNGSKWAEADAWTAEMWFAYHDVFRRMPGLIPDITPWKIYDCVMAEAKRKLKKYRRRL